jgi:hypothetical protein
VPVASAPGGHSRSTTVDAREALTCGSGAGSGQDHGTGRAFQSRGCRAISGPHPDHQRPDCRGQQRSPPAYHLSSSPGHSAARRRSPRSPEISDTEEVTGSNSAAPTILYLTMAFVRLARSRRRTGLVRGAVHRRESTSRLNKRCSLARQGKHQESLATRRQPDADPRAPNANCRPRAWRCFGTTVT